MPYAKTFKSLKLSRDNLIAAARKVDEEISEMQRKCEFYVAPSTGSYRPRCTHRDTQGSFCNLRVCALAL
jgi:hypothetical protein